MKTRGKIAIGVACAVALCAALLPWLVDNIVNRVHPNPPVQVSPGAARLHQSLLIADLHTDALLWNRNLNLDNRRGHVDIARLIRGNIALQAFSVVTKTPRGLNIDSNADSSDNITLLSVAQGLPPATWNSLLRRATWQAERLNAFARASDGTFHVINNSGQLQRYLDQRAGHPRQSAGWLTLEGAHALEGKLANLDVLYRAGFRMAAPTHFFDTELSGSRHGLRKGGLTPLGRDWVGAMEKRRMIIDLAHASDATIADVLALATRPVIVSHTGVRGSCAGRRNLSDAQVRQIAARGGLIGIGFWDAAVCGKDVASIARAIKYAIGIAGDTHVAYGSDFDGAVSTPIDAAGMAGLTQALLDAGLGPDQIRLVAGQNTFDFLLRNLPPDDR